MAAILSPLAGYEKLTKQQYERNTAVGTLRPKDGSNKIKLFSTQDD